MRLPFQKLSMLLMLAVVLVWPVASWANTVNAFGYTFTSIGNANLSFPDSVLHVTNLGSSGNDGVSMNVNGRIPVGDSLIHVWIGSFLAAQWPNVGQYMKAEWVGVVDGIANQSIGSARLVSTGPGNSVLTVDTTPVGPAYTTMVVSRDGQYFGTFDHMPAVCVFDPGPQPDPGNDGGPRPTLSITVLILDSGVYIEIDVNLLKSTIIRDTNNNALLQVGPGHYFFGFKPVNPLHLATDVHHVDMTGVLDDLRVSKVETIPVIHPTNTDVPNGSGNGPVLELSPPFPSPSGDGAISVKYTVLKASHIMLRLYDMMGREVATMIDRDVEAGPQILSNWLPRDHHGRTIPPGVYMLRLEDGQSVSSQRIVLLK